jgi:hypothetical protein
MATSTSGVPTVTATREIGAPAATVFGLVIDLPRMGEWSPENTGGHWIGGATGPALGARFRGSNRKGIRRWSTVAKVTEWKEDRLFTFSVVVGGIPLAIWSYRIEPGDGGCTVTETWTNRTPPLMTKIGAPIMGIPDRAAHNEAGMKVTLERLAATAESAGRDAA